MPEIKFTTAQLKEIVSFLKDNANRLASQLDNAQHDLALKQVNGRTKYETLLFHQRVVKTHRLYEDARLRIEPFGISLPVKPLPTERYNIAQPDHAVNLPSNGHVQGWRDSDQSAIDGT